MTSAVPEALLWSVLAFSPLAFGCVEPWARAVLEILSFGLAAYCLLRSSVTMEGLAHRSLLPSVLAVLSIGAVQSLHPSPVTGPDPGLPFTASAFGTGSELFLWVAFAAVVWAIPLVIRDVSGFRRFAWVLFATGAAVALIGILQRGQGNTHYYFLRRSHQGTMFGPFTNYNHAACFMDMALFLGAGLFFERLKELRDADGIGSLADFAARQSLILFSLGLLAAGIAMTGSRGGLIAAAIATLSMSLAACGLPETRSVRLKARSVLVLAAVAITLYVFFHPNVLGFVQGHLDDSSSYRLSMYRSGLKMIQEHPAFGVGLGALLNSFPYYQESYAVGIAEHIHSSWLELAVTTGVVGFAAFFSGVLFLLMRLLQGWNSGDFETRCLTGGALAAALAFLVHGIVEFNFQIPGNALVFLAILSASSTLLPEKSIPLLGASPKPWIRQSFAAALLLISIPAAGPMVSDWFRIRADGAPAETRVKLMAQAFEWNPDPLLLAARTSATLELSETRPAERATLLQDALRVSDQAMALEPLDNRVRVANAAAIKAFEKAGAAY